MSSGSKDPGLEPKLALCIESTYLNLHFPIFYALRTGTQHITEQLLKHLRVQHSGLFGGPFAGSASYQLGTDKDPVLTGIARDPFEALNGRAIADTPVSQTRVSDTPRS